MVRFIATPAVRLLLVSNQLSAGSGRKRAPGLPRNRAPAVQSGSGSGLGGLDGERDLDLVADEELAALERLVPLDAEVLPVDRGGRLGAQLGLAPRVGLDAEELRGQVDRLGDAVDGQVAGDHVAVA